VLEKISSRPIVKVVEKDTIIGYDGKKRKIQARIRADIG
jgi:hypothetical protein